MIFKRVYAKLRAQDWVAILIELAIVILGVFIGTWVANWNQAQSERAETRRMVEQLVPNLRTMRQYAQASKEYYAITRRYADIAFAGWRGDPKVSDSDFVIAAYQASQIIGFGTNGTTWATILGTDQLREIDNPRLRALLSQLMSIDYTNYDIKAIDTPYRHNVRRVIPTEIQDQIRARCGDIVPDDPTIFTILHSTCDYVIPPAEAARVAALLRADKSLPDDLNWHLASVAVQLSNVSNLELVARDSIALIEKPGKAA